MAYSAFPETGAKATFSEISHNADFYDTECQTSKFENVAPFIKISDFQQFYVRFTTIGIGGSQGSLVPPIGIAIIGINNYIL
jgi:hypothetical protein